jgi:SM-20-related protein
LHTVFDTLIDSFIADRVGLAAHFLQNDLATALRLQLLEHAAEKHLLAAGIGNEASVLHDLQIRSDKIYWLDRKHENPFENQFFEYMDAFVAYLNESCYTGISSYEFHYAWYDTGAFYKRHLDQFRNDDSRAFSMIMYLNTDWLPAHGGELCIYHNDHTQTVSPMFGKSVFFKSSELEHEVLLTNVPRLSITGWLRTNGKN